MIYLVIAFFLFFLSFRFDFLNQKVGRKVFYAVSYIILVLLSGLRYKVGGDTYNYMYVHDLLPNLYELYQFDNIVNREPGWLLLTAITKIITPDFVLIQLIHALFVNAVFFRFFSRYSAYKFTCVFFYYIFFYHYFNFEILRESIAVSFFLLAIEHFKNNKLLKYYILAGIALCFHISSIFLFIFPLLYKLIPTRNVFKFSSILFIINIFLGSIFSSILSIFLLGDILSSKINTYQEYSFTVFGITSSYILYLLVPYILLKNSRIDTNDFLYKFIVIYIYIGAMIPLFSIFFRFLNYMIPFYILLMVVFMMRILLRGKNYTINIGNSVIAFTVLFCILNFKLITKYEEEYWFYRWYPYHSVLDKETGEVRERWYPFLK